MRTEVIEPFAYEMVYMRFSPDVLRLTSTIAVFCSCGHFSSVGKNVCCGFPISLAREAQESALAPRGSMTVSATIFRNLCMFAVPRAELVNSITIVCHLGYRILPSPFRQGPGRTSEASVLTCHMLLNHRRPLRAHSLRVAGGVFWLRRGRRLLAPPCLERIGSIARQNSRPGSQPAWVGAANCSCLRKFR